MLQPAHQIDFCAKSGRIHQGHSHSYRNRVSCTPACAAHACATASSGRHCLRQRLPQGGKMPVAGAFAVASGACWASCIPKTMHAFARLPSPLGLHERSAEVWPLSRATRFTSRGLHVRSPGCSRAATHHAVGGRGIEFENPPAKHCVRCMSNGCIATFHVRAAESSTGSPAAACWPGIRRQHKLSFRSTVTPVTSWSFGATCTQCACHTAR